MIDQNVCIWVFAASYDADTDYEDLDTNDKEKSTHNHTDTPSTSAPKGITVNDHLLKIYNFF